LTEMYYEVPYLTQFMPTNIHNFLLKRKYFKIISFSKGN